MLHIVGVLPDYNETKAKLVKAYLRFFEVVEKHHTGVIGRVPTRHFFEGKRVILCREDGSVSEAGQKQVKAEMKVDLRRLQQQAEGEMIGMVAEHAKEFAFQKSKFLYEKLYQELAQAGQAVDLGGKPITPEVVLSMYSNVHIGFEEDGTPRLPTFVAGSEFGKALAPVLEQISNSPFYGQKLNEIIAKKRMEWREREADRKLVG